MNVLVVTARRACACTLVSRTGIFLFQSHTPTPTPLSTESLPVSLPPTPTPLSPAFLFDPESSQLLIHGRSVDDIQPDRLYRNNALTQTV